ncbi:hypothetical protein [Streptomyces sp. NBC_01481]|uniref:hypothetical protein n=1 Tax=Streptomyces sp. NBC_01481 TaxID=2975869 RepID=UPI0022568535|nr:hypothetical protein [Streptomyces sp. NBC_01481]MCX4587046.1 hypothetical protein [Streptomyces sp. NBC_01481]
MNSTTIDLVPQTTVSTAYRSIKVATGAVATNAGNRLVIGIPESQLYYWTSAWQANEQAAAGELERGEGRHFTDAEEAIRWLLSEED